MWIVGDRLHDLAEVVREQQTSSLDRDEDIEPGTKIGTKRIASQKPTKSLDGLDDCQQNVLGCPGS